MAIGTIGQAGAAEPRLDPPAEREGDVSRDEHEAYGHCHQCCRNLRQCTECFLDDAYDVPREEL